MNASVFLLGSAACCLFVCLLGGLEARAPVSAQGPPLQKRLGPSPKQAAAIASNKKVRIIAIVRRKVSLNPQRVATLVNCASLRLMAARISYGLWTHPDMMAVE